MDEETWEGKIVAEAWKAVSSVPTGPYQVYYGVEAENPSKLWGFFDFDSIEHHHRFAKS